MYPGTCTKFSTIIVAVLLVVVSYPRNFVLELVGNWAYIRVQKLTRHREHMY